MNPTSLIEHREREDPSVYASVQVHGCRHYVHSWTASPEGLRRCRGVHGFFFKTNPRFLARFEIDLPPAISFPLRRLRGISKAWKPV